MLFIKAIDINDILSNNNRGHCGLRYCGCCGSGRSCNHRCWLLFVCQWPMLATVVLLYRDRLLIIGDKTLVHMGTLAWNHIGGTWHHSVRSSTTICCHLHIRWGHRLRHIALRRRTLVNWNTVVAIVADWWGDVLLVIRWILGRMVGYYVWRCRWQSIALNGLWLNGKWTALTVELFIFDSAVDEPWI